MTKRRVQAITTRNKDGKKKVIIGTCIVDDIYYGFGQKELLDFYTMMIPEECIIEKKEASISQGIKDTMIRNAENLEKIDKLEMKLSFLVRELEELRNNNKKKNSREANLKHIETKMLSHEIFLLIEQNNDRFNMLMDILSTKVS